MMSTRQKTEHVVIRMEPELREAIEAAAEEERRPVSNWVRNALADQLKAREADGRAAA
jgi:hypothetical protein